MMREGQDYVCPRACAHVHTHTRADLWAHAPLRRPARRRWGGGGGVRAAVAVERALRGVVPWELAGCRQGTSRQVGNAEFWACVATRFVITPLVITSHTRTHVSQRAPFVPREASLWCPKILKGKYFRGVQHIPDPGDG